MQIGNFYREQWRSMGSWAVDTWDRVISAIQHSYHQEHTENDQHGNVHAETIATGRISFSDIRAITFTTTQVDNLNDASLKTAAVLRASQNAAATVSLTGIQVPTDEDGNILDGRVLIIENADASGVLVLEHEGTSSSPANRFAIPFSPGSASGLTSRYFCYPSTLTMLIYSATKARWVIHARSNQEVESYNTFGSNQNDYAALGNRSANAWRLAATAANLTISGFQASSVSAPSYRVLTNEGLFRFAILHMNTGSSAANRVQCPGGVEYYVNPRESVTLYRSTDGTWHITNSGKADQWIDVTYAAGNFSQSSGTWTVDAGDQITYCYHIDGNKMTVMFRLATTTLSAPMQFLRIKIPAGRTNARQVNTSFPYFDGAAAGTGMLQIDTGSTFIDLYVSTVGTNWPAATNTNSVYGQVTFMVTDPGTISELHTDVAHADTAHADADHSDVAHSDVVHSDTHSDAAHSDAAHSDSAHSDVAHTDTHTDVAHSDVTHQDAVHTDVAHSDTPHSDGHGDAHQDVGGAHHVDQHTDVHSDVTHVDVTHGDAAHTDVAHSDVTHSDTHSDVTHSDVAHVDGAHSDVAHSDAHVDSGPHSDVAHVDAGHSDTPHADTVHQDVGYHTDSAHSDI